MSVARRKIGKGHFMGTSGFEIQLMHLAGKSEWGQPKGHGFFVGKGLEYFFGGCSQHPV